MLPCRVRRLSMTRNEFLLYNCLYYRGLANVLQKIADVTEISGWVRNDENASFHTKIILHSICADGFGPTAACGSPATRTIVSWVQTVALVVPVLGRRRSTTILRGCERSSWQKMCLVRPLRKRRREYAGIRRCMCSTYKRILCM